MTELLERYEWTRENERDDGAVYFVRPGKDSGQGANLKVIDGLPILQVFTDGATVPAGAHPPAAVRCHLEFGGDFGALDAQLRAEGGGAISVQDVTLAATRVGARAQRVVARRGECVVHSDEFNVNSSPARRRYARELVGLAWPDEGSRPADVAVAVEAALLALATASPAPNPKAASADDHDVSDNGYAVIDGNTYHCVFANDSAGERSIEKQMKLANFSAKIVGGTIADDGAEQTREFDIEVQQPGSPVQRAGVPVEFFGTLNWVIERFGVRYLILPGKREHLRCAIQEMSGDVPTATTYRHTGWREVDGRWCYLHGGGAIVPAVPVVPVSASVEVRLDGAAAGFCLPGSPTGVALCEAVRASLGTLDGLVSDTVSFPVLATAYRAALGAADYALWLSGTTGAQKSELAALLRQHYGPTMTRTGLPGNWSSTDNALEGLAFTLKDAVLVIDDFAPSTSRADADRQHRTAERLIRGQGNSAGRQRMRADGTLRPPKPPRALIAATGEDVPRGHSITARLCVLAVNKGDVKLPRLSECQRDAAAGLYAAALAGFVTWLAPRYAAVRAGLGAERVELRNQFVGSYPHARTPDIIANLMIGLRYLLEFAESVAAIDRRQYDALWQRGQTAFRAVAAHQGEHQRAADPVARFAEMLTSIVSGGRAHIAGLDGREPGRPLSPESWGWEAHDFRSGTETTGTNYRARGEKIGWTDGTELYLDPDITYAALTALARDQGQAYPVTQQTLYRRVNEAGLLLRTDTDRTTYPVTLEGSRRRVLVLATALLGGEPGRPGQTGRHAPITGRSVPTPCPAFRRAAPQPGQKTGTNPRQDHGAVPVVPVSGEKEGGGTSA